MQQSGSAKGILYVENPSDRLFWERVVACICPQMYSVKAFSLTKAPGKRSLEKEYNKLHQFYIVGVDGDFDYLCPDRHAHASSLNKNPFVLHTFCYSRENLFCSITSVTDISNQLSFRNQFSHQCVAALTEYSEIIFPALAIFSFVHNRNWQKFKECEFTKAISLPANVKLLTENLETNPVALTSIKASTNDYIQTVLGQLDDKLDISDYCEALRIRGITPDIAYMFINGHYLKDNIVKPMLESVKRKNKNEDLNEIKNTLPNDKWKSGINEVENHFRNCCHTETMIHNSFSYTSGSVWDMIQNKLKKLL